MKPIYKRGKFHDAYRGDGYFASVLFECTGLLIAVRWRWRLAFLKMPYHQKTRVYIGPIEIEIAKFPALKGQQHDK